ncbi:MAG: hypothetical protein L3J91_01130 [Thermoplasmata archaeon]|nr:hypothetical protein [Thermoplasmata archaeon]
MIFVFALLVLPLSGPARGDVALQLSTQSSIAGATSFAPMSAVTVSAAGGCRSTETTTLPFGSGSDRANVAVVEPRGCGTRTRLTFLPGDQFTDALSAAASHVLTARLDLVAMNGSTTMLRNVQLYVQRSGGANPIVTGTHILVRNGVTTTASTSTATLAPATSYGIGLRMTLTHLAAAGLATLTVVLSVTLDDGGVVRAIQFEWVSLLLIY